MQFSRQGYIYPVQFKNIIGQQALKEKLIQSVRDKKIAHANLFLGAEGSGQLAFAVAYAQYLDCENCTDDDSCGECSSCVKSQKLIHPDIHFTYPVISKKNGESISKPTSTDFIEEWRKEFLNNPYLSVQDWLDTLDSENRLGNISAEECRRIVHTQNLKSFESPFKVFILWMPDLLGKEGNILLKSLEEPPVNTIFILAGENEEKILSTILSRVQITKVPRLKDEEIIFQLEKNPSLSNKEAHAIARHADGNFNEALKLAGSIGNDNEKMFLHFLRICLKGNNEGMNLIGYCDKIAASGRENLKGVLQYGLELMHEIFMLQHAGESKARLTENEMRLAQYINEHLAFQSKEEMIKKLEESHYHLERNANPKILFMNLGISFSQLLKRNEVVLT